MTYEINKSNGSVLTYMSDNEIDISTSVRLVGKNYPGYGEIIAEDLVNILENFANDRPPPNPMAGQFWFNSTEKKLYFFNLLGNWQAITDARDATRSVSLRIADTNNVLHYIRASYVNNILVLIESSDASFVPAASTTLGIDLVAFPKIYPGFTISQASRTDGDAYLYRN